MRTARDGQRGNYRASIPAHRIGMLPGINEPTATVLDVNRHYGKVMLDCGHVLEFRKETKPQAREWVWCLRCDEGVMVMTDWHDLAVRCTECGTLSCWNLRQQDRAALMVIRHLKDHPSHTVDIIDRTKEL